MLASNLLARFELWLYPPLLSLQVLLYLSFSCPPSSRVVSLSRAFQVVASLSPVDSKASASVYSASVVASVYAAAVAAFVLSLSFELLKKLLMIGII